MKKIDFYTKAFLLFCIIYSFVIIYSWGLSPPITDEGMHLTLGVFYHDIINYILHNGISSAVEYSINYLVHYPKLSVYYPPLYHIFLSGVFNVSMSLLAARISTLFISIGSLVIIYKIFKELQDKKTALITSLLFGFSPIFIYLSRKIMIENLLMFLFLLSLFFYIKAEKTDEKKYYIFGGITLALSIVTKQSALVIIPLLLIYFIIRNRKKTKLLLFSFLLACVILAPYVYIYNNFHLINLASEVSVEEAINVLRIPQFWTIEGWLYYPIQILYQLSIPLGILSMLYYIYFIYKKEKNWKLILIWTITTYIFFTILPLKRTRYTIFYLPPLIFCFSYYLKNKLNKNKLLATVIIFLIIFETISGYLMIPKFNTDYDEITNYVYNNTKGNIAFISEGKEMWSSVFIFYMLKKDRNLTLSVSRPCIFENKTPEEIQKIIEDNNIYYLIYAPDEKENLTRFNMKLEKKFRNVELYRIDDFYYKEKNYTCNYVCRIKNWLCTNMTKREVFSKI